MTNLINTKEAFIKIGMCQEAIDYYEENNLWGTTEEYAIEFLKSNNKPHWVAWWLNKKSEMETAEIVKVEANIDLIGGKFVVGNFTDKADTESDALILKEQFKKDYLSQYSFAVNHCDTLPNGDAIWHIVENLADNPETANTYQVFNHFTGSYHNDLSKQEALDLIASLKEQTLQGVDFEIYQEMIYPDGSIAYKKVSN